ncbi:MAG: tellurite resistance TerB family protein [Xanthobacteraceae bacterium]|nr:tellurite resistance TerB family protein [Xanthobacteraceae bacterium]
MAFLRRGRDIEIFNHCHFCPVTWCGGTADYPTDRQAQDRAATVRRTEMSVERILSELVGNASGAQVMTAPQGTDGRSPSTYSATQQPGWLGHAGALGLGAAAGGIAGVMFGSKRLRDLAGTALQVGAVAAIGGIAYKAYQNYREGRPVVPQNVSDFLAARPWQQSHQGDANGQPNALAAFIPPPDQSDKVALLMLKAMVAAAAVDGRLDPAEHEQIRRHIAASDFAAEEQRTLELVISHPSSIEELASAATTPALCAEVYTAARLAIEPDSPAEREWLDKLAKALAIDPRLRAHLDAVGTVQQSAAAA